MSFGVFYTCYKEEKAVDNSIKVLKQVYPDVPIYLVSDGGSDYSFLENKYTNLKCKMGWDSRGISQRFTIEKWQDPNNRKKVLDSINEFFKRNEEAIQFCKTESILIMEPDVLVRGKLNYFPTEKTPLLGSRVNKPTYSYFNNMIDFLKSIPGSFPLNYYGSTPAFYSSNVMLKLINYVKDNQDIVKKFIDLDHSFVCYDVFLTLLFATIGYDETFNPDIIECLRDYNWEKKSEPLVHQYRLLYPKQNSGYDGRHAV